MNKERVLNLAVALERGPQDKSALKTFHKRHPDSPTHFDMSKIFHPCNTPACVWGHYVASDLQDAFRPNLKASWDVEFVEDGKSAPFNGRHAREHFDLESDDLMQLFAAPHDDCDCNCDNADEDDVESEIHAPDCIWHGGCGGAKTVEEAAAYIRAFVAKREAEGSE